jgi:peptide/nickel transport system substrate-binding protein
VDRAEIVNSTLEGHAEVLAGIMPRGWLGYDPDLEPWPYDPAKAKSLLQEAGLGSGFEFGWEITDGVFLRDREVAESVAAQLAEVGVRANLRITERAVQFEHFYAGTWDGLNTLQWPTMKDPDGNMIWNWKTSKSMAEYQPYNVLRDLNDKAAATYDEAEREQFYLEENRRGWQMCPWLYVHVQNEIFARSKDIPWVPYPMTGQATESWYYDRTALA